MVEHLFYTEEARVRFPNWLIKETVVTRDDIRCPIRLAATEDFPSRRCWYHTGTDGICPEHGNVTAFLKLYHKTRSLTEVSAIPKTISPIKSSVRTKFKRFIESLLFED